ncbi:MAG: hypothetical protein IT294_06865 [Deltaproteobacteria bacterium]|nr:hypothetical protein [Deltaproteobacteria bacterium]
MRRMTGWRMALAATLVLASAGSSGAGAPLTTGYLPMDNNQYVRCVISNIGTKDVVVEKIETVNVFGVAAVQVNEFTLAPGATNPNVFVFESSRCVFSVKKRKLVRAYGCVSNLASALCLAESEAR